MPVHQNSVQQELVLDSVTGWDQDLKEVLRASKHELLGNLFVPFEELVSLSVNALLVDVDIFDEICGKLGHLIFEVQVKLCTIIIMDVSSDGPDHREGNIVVDHFVCFFPVLKLDSIFVEEDVDEFQAG